MGRVCRAHVHECEFSIFTDGEARAFETCAEFVLQKGFWELSGRLPSLMLDGDQLFYPNAALGD